MPINKPSLKPNQKIYTKQDFEKGKCTSDGFPLGEAPIDEKPLVPKQPVAPTEKVSGDSPDSKKSPNNTDGQKDSGKKDNPKTA